MTNPVVLMTCQKHGITPEVFFGSGRMPRMIACRTEAAQIFRARGFSWDQIARLLKRDRETIRYWLCPETRERRRAKMLQRYYEIYRGEVRA